MQRSRRRWRRKMTLMTNMTTMHRERCLTMMKMTMMTNTMTMMNQHFNPHTLHHHGACCVVCCFNSCHHYDVSCTLETMAHAVHCIHYIAHQLLLHHQLLIHQSLIHRRCQHMVALSLVYTAGSTHYCYYSSWLRSSSQLPQVYLPPRPPFLGEPLRPVEE